MTPFSQNELYFKKCHIKLQTLKVELNQLVGKITVLKGGWFFVFLLLLHKCMRFETMIFDDNSVQRFHHFYLAYLHVSVFLFCFLQLFQIHP